MSKTSAPIIEWMSKRVAPLSPQEYLLQQADDLLVKNGQTEPPFDPEKAAPETIKRIEKVNISRDGMLIPVEHGFVIRLNSGLPKVRQRFACAHEIGHTFFFDLSGSWPFRPRATFCSHREKDYWMEDGLCHEFAEEMLMPQSVLRRVAGPPSIANFRRLVNTFMVSSEAMVRRIRRLNLWECIIFMLSSPLELYSQVGDEAGCELDRANGRKSFDPLKLDLSYRHPKHKYIRVRWDALLKKESSPHVASKQVGKVDKAILRDEEFSFTRKPNRRWYLESCRFTRGSRKVICLITSNEI